MFNLPSSMRHERDAAIRAEALLDALGVPHLSQKSAAHATLAEARILDLARALALDPVVLLLDEPAAGLDLDEIAVLEAMVGAAREAGVGVLLVEHDVGFVIRLADHVTVLDRGRVIANGPPEEIRNDQAVKAAYFGDVELEEAVVG
jgi:branched-chain amino acid transport system ATP-binding protein